MQKLVPDNVILEEAVRLVNEGIKVTFPVNGKSMRPFIVDGESVVLEKSGRLKTADIVLAKVSTGSFVIHRIVGFNDNGVVLMGDGNLQQREFACFEDIVAVVTTVIGKSGKSRNVSSLKMRIAAKFWMFFCPLRKWLLKVCG